MVWPGRPQQQGRKPCRRLTHRAVDTVAAVPAGTTSRYFRTRDALLNGVIERITHRLGERVDAYTLRPISPADLEEALVAVLTTMLTDALHGRSDLIGGARTK
ncbi:TetR/AcrR family transcriptional regulator [Nonomuraea sp. NPDC049714]|uniref:TetR/AcrR family transcriptional regulator n=1 Tax=Nonomuraea sp. NPDC049714 TaxID=3364357 RepID=UPI0037927C52